jgi:hypothetical protein
VATVGPVIGADHDLASLAQLGLQDHPLARAAPDDARHLDAAALQLEGDRQDDGRADASPHADRVPGLDQLGRPAERPGDIGDGVARLELDQVGRALADRLDDQADRAGVRVGRGDGERDPLRAWSAADDHELPGLPDLCDAGRLDHEPGDVRREL